MTAPQRHLVIMAAGTGGHVMPGLAVAQVMSQRGWSVSWLGTPAGMENRLVPPSGIALDRIAFAGLRGKGLAGMVRGAVQLVWSLGQCAAILRRRGASAVLGMGGYVCVPGGLVARLLRRPLVLVNADAALLLSNRALARWADRIAFGFDGDAARSMPRALVTGNPVRAEIEALPGPTERFAGRSGPMCVLYRVNAGRIPRDSWIQAPEQGDFSRLNYEPIPKPAYEGNPRVDARAVGGEAQDLVDHVADGGGVGVQQRGVAHHSPIRPRRSAFSTAWCLLTQPSLCIALLTCSTAVRSLIPRMAPTSQAVLPSIVQRSASSSRPASPAR